MYFKKRRVLLSLYTMKQITLTDAENKFKTFLDFVKTLNYTKVVEAEETAVNELQNSLMQVKLIQTGKLPKKSAEQLLDELSS